MVLRPRKLIVTRVLGVGDVGVMNVLGHGVMGPETPTKETLFVA